MDTNINDSNWDDGDFDSTADPSVLMISEEVPTLTVTTILGVTVVLLIAIVLVFVLGFLIDWRQQRLLDKRMGEVKRKKAFGRKRTKLAGDVVSIANNMEEASTSTPPAEALKHIVTID